MLAIASVRARGGVAHARLQLGCTCASAGSRKKVVSLNFGVTFSGAHFLGHYRFDLDRIGFLGPKMNLGSKLVRLSKIIGSLRE